jgi:hypothetical protein
MLANLWEFQMQLCLFFLFSFQTEKGSALHEAALFGKVDVVRVLLETGSYHGSPWSLSCQVLWLSIPGLDERRWWLSSQMTLFSNLR